MAGIFVGDQHYHRDTAVIPVGRNFEFGGVLEQINVSRSRECVAENLLWVTAKTTAAVCSSLNKFTDFRPRNKPS